jgi:hypothetical protein
MRLLPFLLAATLHSAALQPARSSNATGDVALPPALLRLDESNYMDHVSASEYLLVEVCVVSVGPHPRCPPRAGAGPALPAAPHTPPRAHHPRPLPAAQLCAVVRRVPLSGPRV